MEIKNEESRAVSKWKEAYDQGRKYNKHWEDIFPWVKESENGRPFCQWCGMLIIPKKHALTQHHKSHRHRANAEIYDETGFMQADPGVHIENMGSMPSIEVLASEQPQNIEYSDANATVFTYMDETVRVGDGQLTYFTEPTNANDQLSGVIKECFAVNEDELIDNSFVDSKQSPTKNRAKRVKMENVSPIRKKTGIVTSTPAGQGMVKSNQNGSLFRAVPCNVPNPINSYQPEKIQTRHSWSSTSPLKLFDQNIGMGITPDSCTSASSSLYMRGRRGSREASGISIIKNLADNFSILLEVPHFHADELKVRVSGKVLEIEAKHEEREDEHGRIGRYFIRKYTLPDDVMLDKITSSLSEEGVLTVDMPKKKSRNYPKKNVPIVKKEKSKPDLPLTDQNQDYFPTRSALSLEDE